MRIQDRFGFDRLLAMVFILALASSCGTVDSSVKKPVKKPAMVPAARWQENLPSGSFRSQAPQRITLVHSGRNTAAGNDLQGYIKELHSREIQSGHGHLSAHYYIDPFGGIYEGRQLFLQGRLPEGLEMDCSGHVLIMALGDYRSRVPTEEFKKSLASLVAWLCDRQDIPLSNFHGLNYYLRTDNPGKYLIDWLESPELEYLLKEAMGIKAPTPIPTPKPAETPVQ